MKLFSGQGSKKTKVLFILVILVLVLGGVSTYYFMQYQKIKKNPQSVSQHESDVLISQVSKLIDVPKDETPTIATVQDKEKLKDQPFFANAQNGDKIIIYTKAKKAIIYRQKENRLINVGPIAIDQTQSTATPITLVSAGGDVSKAEKTLNEKLTGQVSVVDKTSAKTSNFSKTVVVDLSGKNSDLATKIASTLGGDVEKSVPSGETKPTNASIVVFVK